MKRTMCLVVVILSMVLALAPAAIATESSASSDVVGLSQDSECYDVSFQVTVRTCYWLLEPGPHGEWEVAEAYICVEQFCRYVVGDPT